MPDLNCTEFETQLMELVETHRSLDELTSNEAAPQSAIWQDLRAQANACPHCRGLWNEFALLERVLPMCKELTPPVNLADAVIARWREETDGEAETRTSAAQLVSQPATRRTGFALALVAVLAILAGFAFLYSPGPNDELAGTVPVVIHNEPKLPDPSTELNQPAVETEAELNWQAMAEDAGSAYWALASDAADSFASANVFVPPRKPAEKPAINPENQPAAGWTNGIGAGLKPIGQDVGRAMGFLFDAIPGENTL